MSSLLIDFTSRVNHATLFYCLSIGADTVVDLHATNVAVAAADARYYHFNSPLIARGWSLRLLSTVVESYVNGTIFWANSVKYPRRFLFLCVRSDRFVEFVS